MTSLHTYAATIGATTLPIKSGEITLDATRAPHVSATIVIPFPSAPVLSTLDPRTSPAPRVTVTASAGIPRVFDLHVRDLSVDEGDATVTLALASDEGLLTDYAPLDDDSGPLAYSSSLRGIVNYVLNKAFPGVALQASPSGDADMTPFWALTNLAANPAAAVDTSGWITAGLAPSTLTRVTGLTVANRSTGLRATWGSGSGYWDIRSEMIPVAAGKSYYFSADLRASSSRTLQMRVEFYDDTTKLTEASVDYAASTTWTLRAWLFASAPPRANKARVFVRNLANGASGQWFEVTAMLVAQTTITVPYFDGASSDPNYLYAWSGTGGASASSRTPNPIERDPEALVWRAGQSGMDYLQPLVQAAGYRLVCDETRKWTLRNETYTAPGSLNLRTGVNLITAQASISRDEGLWCDARVTRYSWTDRNGLPQVRVDAYALALPYSRVTLLELNTPYPGPGRSAYAVRRAQGLGREVTVETVSDWSARADQPAAVVMTAAPTGLGRTQTVTYDLDTDRMRVVTRTVDTPAGAIDLLTGTINALTGTINAL